MCVSNVSHCHSQVLNRMLPRVINCLIHSTSIQHLGGLKDIHGSPPTGEDNQSDILESIDTAQRQGRLPWVTHDYDKCVLNVSRYGVKATDEQRKVGWIRVTMETVVL